MPAIARPRRPLSIRASHASWSIRFSLRMMISGAPSSRSRLRRLLRLMTRRYRSFRSEVAKRPPSSWTIGRRSGGMTGRTDRIIQSGRVPAAAEGLDEAEPLDRLLAALAGARPDLDVEGPRELLEVHPADDLADRLGAHAGAEQAAALGAGAVALLEAAELGLAERLHRLERPRSRRAACLLLVLERPGPAPASCSLLVRGASRRRRPAGRRPSARPRAPRRVSRCWSSALTRSVSAETILRRARGGLLAALVAGGDDDLAGRGEDDRVLGLAGLQLGEPGLDRLGGGDDLLGPDGALALEVGLRRGQLGVAARPWSSVDVGAELVLELGELARRPCRRGPRPRPRAASRARLRASSSTWVTMYRAK